MGSSYSIEELQEHIYGLKFEVEHFQGTMASKQYQKLQKDLIAINSEVLRLKKNTKGKSAREYNIMLNELSLCLKQLTQKVTTSNPSTTNEEQPEEEVVPLRNLKQDPASIIENYEKQLEELEVEIQNLEIENLKQVQIIQAKLKIFYTQLAITKIEVRSELDVKRNALFHKIVHCYKLMKKYAKSTNDFFENVAEKLEAERHNTIDSDFDSDFDSDVYEWSRSTSARTTLDDTGSVFGMQPNIPRRNLSQHSSQSDYVHNHIYENIEIVLQEKRKLMERQRVSCNDDSSYYNIEAVKESLKWDSKCDANNHKEAQISLPVPKENIDHEFIDDEDEEKPNSVNQNCQQDKSKTVFIFPPVPKDALSSIDDFLDDDDDDWIDDEQDTSVTKVNNKGKPTEIYEQIECRDTRQSENISLNQQIFPPVRKDADNDHYYSDFEFLDDSTDDELIDKPVVNKFVNDRVKYTETNNVDATKQEKIDYGVTERNIEIKFISDEEEDSDEDSPEALNLELLNTRQAYIGKSKATPSMVFKPSETCSLPSKDKVIVKPKLRVPQTEAGQVKEEKNSIYCNYNIARSSFQKTSFLPQKEVKVNLEIQEPATKENSVADDFHPQHSKAPTDLGLKVLKNKTEKPKYKSRVTKSVDCTQEINNVVEAVEELKVMNEKFRSSKDYKIYGEMQEKLMKTIKAMFNINQSNFDKKSLILYEVVSKDLRTFINQIEK